jgi:predicted transcriptional regulator
MSHLEKEVDDVLKNLNIQNKKLSDDNLKILISRLCEEFFVMKSRFLDPAGLRVKHSEHNPDFWHEISEHIIQGQLIFVVFDTAYRAWEIESPQLLEHILSETTGYPFWVTDVFFSFLVYMDDHDCVQWA